MSSLLPGWNDVQRLLVVRLDNLGDVLLQTPAIRALRRAIPLARITLLASPVGTQIGRLDPDIDDVITYQSPQMDPWGQLPHDPARELAMVARLAEGQFDAAVTFTSFRQSSLPAAYLCYMAGIPLRAAASVDGSGSLLTTRHKHAERMIHEVERSLDLIGALGVPPAELDLVLRVPDLARASVARDLARPLVVIHPGCSMPARTYPADMFAQVGDLLVEQLGATVMITGGPDERELVTHVRGAMRQPAIAAAGDRSFAEFCALVEAADLVVTNNTGPMHMAAALKTPVIALFALTNPPEQWGPWRVPHRVMFHDVPCRICYSRVCPFGHECLRKVTPAMVCAAATELLAECQGANR